MPDPVPTPRGGSAIRLATAIEAPPAAEADRIARAGGAAMRQPPVDL